MTLLYECTLTEDGFPGGISDVLVDGTLLELHIPFGQSGHLGLLLRDLLCLLTGWLHVLH